MPTPLRIATFNIENFDDKAGETPTLAQRIAIMRPQLVRLRADVLCLQEVNGQEQPGHPRRLLALDQLVAGTEYAAFHRVSTVVADGTQVFDVRNLAILSRFPIAQHRQIKHDIIAQPAYRRVTAQPPDAAAVDVTWERPILYARLTLPGGRSLHVVNLHLKSRIPADINGQKIDQYTWRSIAGWAEGSFLSSMRRVGQALEARALIDQLFDAEADALIVACGDYNGDFDDVSVETIRGDVENTGNGALANRVMVPCERSVPEPARFSLYHHGRGVMFDHVVACRAMLQHYRGTEVHNELLHDESVAFARDVQFPESDHAPVVADFVLP